MADFNRAENVEINNNNSLAYVFHNKSDFSFTQYKVIKNQSEYLVGCTKIIFNGKIKLIYFTKEMRTLYSLLPLISDDQFYIILRNILYSLVEVKSNGFLSVDKVLLSIEKIYVDPKKMDVKLIYLPTDTLDVESKKCYRYYCYVCTRGDYCNHYHGPWYGTYDMGPNYQPLRFNCSGCGQLYEKKDRVILWYPISYSEVSSEKLPVTDFIMVAKNLRNDWWYFDKVNYDNPERTTNSEGETVISICYRSRTKKTTTSTVTKESTTYPTESNISNVKIKYIEK